MATRLVSAIQQGRLLHNSQPGPCHFCIFCMFSTVWIIWIQNKQNILKPGPYHFCIFCMFWIIWIQNIQKIQKWQGPGFSPFCSFWIQIIQKIQRIQKIQKIQKWQGPGWLSWRSRSSWPSMSRGHIQPAGCPATSKFAGQSPSGAHSGEAASSTTASQGPVTFVFFVFFELFEFKINKIY